MAESENVLNLLPDKPCRYCKIMPKSGPKCKNCDCVLHPGCVNYIKNVKIIDDNQVICCTSGEVGQADLSELRVSIDATNVHSSEVSSTEINYLKSILAHKDLIISNQKDTIESLKAQVGLLNRLLSSTYSNTEAASVKQTDKIPSYSDVIKNKKSVNNKAIETSSNKPNADNVSKIVTTDKSKSLKLLNKQKSKINEILNLNNDLPSNNIQLNNIVLDEESLIGNTDYITVSNKRTKKTNKTTLGTNINQCEITAVASRRQIFISRLSPNTTVNQLQSHLKKQNITFCNIEKLQIRSTEIAAYKVTIPSTEETAIFNPDNWPQFATIRPFYNNRNFQKFEAINTNP
ncbi:hypothetical protein RN001_004268 [Aquatica leii]|uniref:Phorbol-ester/DAG-type domain-containing protein n=1 Tax=Aquatica leii TaxID=1421715 RepID=A0AAN7SHZ7_9COLE|nr:hypothetical protein RN001_004268 [Aquatica leii]